MFHFFHRWCDWEIAQTGKLVDADNPSVEKGTYAIRHRQCHGCNKYEREIQHNFYSTRAAYIADEKPDESIDPNQGLYFKYKN